MNKQLLTISLCLSLGCLNNVAAQVTYQVDAEIWCTTCENPNFARLCLATVICKQDYMYVTIAVAVALIYIECLSAPTKVLLSASCSFDHNTIDFYTRPLPGVGTFYSFARHVSLHPDFNITTKAGDVSVAHLEIPLPLSADLTAIDLSSVEPVVGESVSVGENSACR